jgi:hypothetical protein
LDYSDEASCAYCVIEMMVGDDKTGWSELEELLAEWEVDGLVGSNGDLIADGVVVFVAANSCLREASNFPKNLNQKLVGLVQQSMSALSQSW